MTDAQPVSWLVVEPGWKVTAADGTEVGKVERVLGDTAHDIFDGLAISTGVLARPRYLPAENVAEITAGQIKLNLDADEVERLDEYREPPAAERILPETASLWQRIAGWFRS